MKQLLSHLRYVQMGKRDTLPSIISSGLTQLLKEKILKVLKADKLAMGLTIMGIQGIIPSAQGIVGRWT